MPKFCSKCGKNNLKTDAKFCKFCGGSLGAERIKSKPKKSVEIKRDSLPSLWRRYFAYIVDMAAVFPIAFAIGILWVTVGLGLDAFDELSPFLDWLFSGLIMALYLAFMENRWGSSVGKWLFNIKVCTEEGNRISFKTAFLRNIVKPIPYFPIVEWFVAVKNENKQSLHDRWAHTCVIDMDESYKGETQQYHPQTWQKILVIVAALSFTIYYYSDSIEEGGASTAENFIREGVRDIENRMLLNTDLFSAIEKRNNIETNELVSSDFNFSNQMSAIVSLVCEEDDGDVISGTAIVISEDGLLLTNKHGVASVTENYCLVGFTRDPALEPDYTFYADTEFYLEDDTSYTISNDDIDAAILQIVSPVEDAQTMPSTFPTIGTLGSSDSLVFNDDIYVIGYPSFGGNTLTLTKGVMSGRLGDDYIKTSAKIDSGNSGGAALNENGELIGLPTFIIGGTEEGLGYIVGIDSIMDWLKPLFE